MVGGQSSQNVGHLGWPTTKMSKAGWLKCPKTVRKNPEA